MQRKQFIREKIISGIHPPIETNLTI